MLRPAIVRGFRNRVLNIHPALLPHFGGPGMYGMKVHEAVLETGCKVSGASVHIVDEEYDHGPIVCQQTVKIDHDETVESLWKKIQKVEHKLFPEAIRLLETRKLKVEGRRVVLT